MDLKMPEGVTLKASQAPGKWYIMNGNTQVGSIAEWPSRPSGEGGTVWESRGYGFVLLGEYGSAQEALNASLKDSGIIKD